MSIILLNYKCNKKCYYCNLWKEQNIEIVDLTTELLNTLEYSVNKLLEFNNEKIVISGGEPGMLNQEYLDKFFSIFPSYSTNIFTNGLFIKNGYSKRYADKIAFHTIHICDDEEHLPIMNHNCRYIYVVNKTNINKLHEISKLYSNIIIDIKLYETSKENDPLRLDDSDIIEIQNICLIHDNLNFGLAKHVIHDNDKRLSTYISLCRKHPFLMEFDLPYNTINHCCNSNIKNMSITKTNFKKFFNDGIGQEIINIEQCNNCGLIKNQGFTFFNNMIKTLINFNVRGK